jgi:hypothetical protein
MTQISQGVALELIRQLLQNAAEYEADIIVTLCPMCQLTWMLIREMSTGISRQNIIYPSYISPK